MREWQKAIKSLIAGLLALTLTVSMLPVTVYADEVKEDETVVATDASDTVTTDETAVVTDASDAATTGETTVALAATGETAGSYTAITANDFLKASGRDLRNANGTGEIVNLRGTNAGGYFVQEFWMTVTDATTNVADQQDIMAYLSEKYGQDTMYELIDLYEDNYWTEEDFKNVADLGLNCIRLPFWWRNLVDENGNWYGYDASAADPYAKAFERMDWFVSTAAKYGLYTILDFHGAPGSQNGSDHSGVDGGDAKQAASEFFFGDNATKNQELYYKMLDVIAARYAGNPAVAGYDLLNEPFCTYVQDSYHEMLWNVYDIAYDHIRAVDPDHVIIMEAVWNADALPAPALYGWDNVMYEYHQYNYSDYDNAAGTQITSMQSKLDGIKNADYDVPSYIGEFSLFNAESAWDQGLEIMTKSGINWTTWTYKTVASYGMWGLYHHPENAADINLETASLDQIKEAWSNVGTDKGTANEALQRAVSKWANAETYANTLGATSGDIPSGDYYFKANNTQNILSLENDVVISKDTEEVTDAETFTLENVSGIIYIKSKATGKYLAYNEADKTLKATADSIDTAEKFLINDYTLNTVTVKAKSLGLVIKENADNAAVTVDGSGKPLGDQSFQLYSAATNELYNIEAVNKAKTTWTRYEGEDAEIVGGSTENQKFYSNAYAASGLNTPDIKVADVADDWSNIKYVKFNVNVATAGKYQVVVTYNGNDDKEILVKVNDGAAEEVSLPSRDGGDWSTIATTLLTLDLNAGDNTIYLSGAIGSGWCNYDCIDVVNVPLVEQKSGALRYEGENHFASGYEISGGSQYSGSKANGGLNQNIALDQFTEDWVNVRHTDYTVYAAKAGTYTITFGYDGNNSSDMTVVYSVNGGANTELSISAAGWSSAQTKKFDVELNEGFNDIKISGCIGNTSDWANDDYIDVILAGSEKAKAISGFVRYEGENAKIVSGGNEEQKFFSGGSSASDLSRDEISVDTLTEDWSAVPHAEFTVNVNHEGTYRVVLAYNGDDDKKSAVMVNGNITVLDIPAVTSEHHWDVVYQKVFTVDLKEGKNTIYMTGALGGNWLNIDYIDVSNYPVIINEDGSERYEAENFDTKSANKPVAEHQDFYSGLDEDNGVGGMGATYTSYELGQNILDTAMNYTDYSVFADKEGYYDITVAGNGAGNDLKCVYSINGEATKTFVLPNAGQGWNHMTYATIHVKLNAGYNDVLMAGTYNGSWLNYDYIDVIWSESQVAAEEEEETKITGPYETEDGYMRYEAELAECHECTVETQGMYSGNDTMNGVGAMAGTDEAFTIGDDITAYNLHYLTFTINAEVKGTYQIVIAANGGECVMPVAYQVNGGASQSVTLDNTVDGYNWDRMLYPTIEVELNAGDNEFILAGTYEYIDGAWLNYDYIDVKLLEEDRITGPYEIEDGYMRYEAELADIHGAKAEQQYMYSGNADLNGVGAMAGTDENFTIGDDIRNADLHYLIFNINAEKAGTYEIIITANGADKAMPVAYMVNGGASKSVTLDNSVAGYGWDRLLKTSIEVELNEGDNEFVLAGTYEYIDGAWLNYDCIDVKLVKEKETTPAVTPSTNKTTSTASKVVSTIVNILDNLNNLVQKVPASRSLRRIVSKALTTAQKVQEIIDEDTPKADEAVEEITEDEEEAVVEETTEEVSDASETTDIAAEEAPLAAEATTTNMLPIYLAAAALVLLLAAGGAALKFRSTKKDE